jgi:hypothetical protein
MGPALHVSALPLFGLATLAQPKEQLGILKALANYI